MKIIITNRIYIYNCKIPEIKKQLQDYTTIQNPKYIEAKKAGRNTYHIEKTVSMFKNHPPGNDFDSCFSIPRGCEDFLNIILDKYCPDAEFDDRTIFDEQGIDYDCAITPRQDQVPVIAEAMKYDSGVICLSTGFGKTAIAIYMIAQRKQRAFILVHSKLLLYQWRDRIKQFLNYDCGLAGDGKFIIKDITVGLTRTVINRSKKDDFCKSFGFLVTDECHKTPGSTFTEAVSLFQPYYLTGLSATPARRDKLTDFIFFTLGPIVYKIDKSESVKKGVILKPKINKIKTGLWFNREEKEPYTTLISRLKNSEERNHLICEKISKELNKNYACLLVISDHTRHLEKFENILTFMGIKYHLLTGKLTTKQTKKVTKELSEGKVEVLLATAGLLQEGYDHSGFSDMFLTMPISHFVRHEQLIGRLVRTEQGKKSVTVHDFVDNDIVFQKQWEKRLKVYNSY